MELISAVYNTKRNGSKTEPCRLPQTNGFGNNVVVTDKWTVWVLPVTYESKHIRTVASMLNECYSFCKRILWSTISNAVIRSSSASNVTLPASSVSITSENTFRMAFSVSKSVSYFLFNYCLSKQVSYCLRTSK